MERLQQEKEAAEAANREYEAKLERPRKGRLMGTSFDGQGGGGSADRGGTAATTMGPMWTREVSVGGGLGQGLLYVPLGVVCSSGCCTKIPRGMPSLRLHRLGATV